MNKGKLCILLSLSLFKQMELKDSNSVFMAVTHMGAGSFLIKIFKKKWKSLIEAHDKHTGEEGENLKKILESENMHSSL
ncbi:MAG: hypothetical protein ACETWK_13205 [Candidatus Aminicenantaceae bacterium]